MDWWLKLLGEPVDSELLQGRWTTDATWVHRFPWLPLILIAGTLLLVGWIYRITLAQASRRLVLGLTLLRTLIFLVLLVIVLEPVWELTLARTELPEIWILLDSSESMQLRDFTAPSAAPKSSPAITTSSALAPLPTRQEVVRRFLEAEDKRWLRKFAERAQCRIFTFSGSHPWEELTAHPLEAIPWERWSCDGEVTALGDALWEVSRRANRKLQGVLVFSDFQENTGLAAREAARALSIPIHTIGVGPTAAPDMSVELMALPATRRGETIQIHLTVKQTELTGNVADVTLEALPRDATTHTADALRIASLRIPLTEAQMTREVPWIPQQSGRFILRATLQTAAAEITLENNQQERELQVLEDYLRLLFIEHEPTWEWRFIKEVFHRDPLVGVAGFRTYLRSASPRVREENPLFLPTMNLPRRDFFATDVVFLGDLPAGTLSRGFHEQLRQFVEEFGGGLVLLTGPRYGPGVWQGTPLEEMLPVRFERLIRPRHVPPFRWHLTAYAALYDFMQVGTHPDDMQVWQQFGPWYWYYPVQHIDPRAVVLAEHPHDTLADGRTKHPIIAIRRFGRGEVVYVGTNELWKLRRLHGDEKYRRFWGSIDSSLGAQSCPWSAKTVCDTQRSNSLSSRRDCHTYRRSLR
ncbi:MAG: hypothetical protein KatS3mg113_0269 [Planctomycetaceae bacterium]|nr:MAG: hypothetical protein KatS3mg113_0269 [Planctomycetaceae bacterium]